MKFFPAKELLAPSPDGSFRRVIVHSDPIRMVATSFAVGEIVRLHAHPGADEVFYVVSGSATFVVGGDEVTATEGDVIVVEPGEYHTLRADPPFVTILAVVAPNLTPGAVWPDEPT